MPRRTPAEQRTLTLRLICLRPPLDEGTELGMQDRDQGLHAGRELADGALAFEIPVTVGRRESDDAVRYAGPFVHGTAAAPFLYLSLRRLAADPGAWVRRLKIPLPEFTWEQALDAAGRGVLVGHVSGEGSGTVRLEGSGWEWQDNA